MATPRYAIHDCIVRERAPADHASAEAAITILRDRLAEAGESSAGGTVAMLLTADTTAAQVQSIASALQAQGEGLSCFEASDGGAT